MEFGHLKSKIETKLVESYKTNTFNKEIKTFRKLVLENELINMAYHLYEELSKEKGFSKDFADDFLSECVDIYQRLNITEKSPKLLRIEICVLIWIIYNLNSLNNLR
mgnify:CR=1 FL=1